MNFSYLYILFLLGYIFSIGTFNLSGLIILLTSFILFIIYKHRKEDFLKLAQANILVLGLSLLTEHLLYPSFPQANYIIKFFLMIAFILSFSYIFPKSFYNRKYTFPLLLIIAMFLRIFVIFASPNPKIDVYFLIKEAPKFLLNGINPYSIRYTQIYPQVTPDYYTYLPLSIILFLPFTYLFHDPRFFYLLVYLIIISLIIKTVHDKTIRELYIILILFQPLSLLVLEQGYLDIALVGFLTFSFYLLKLKKEKLASLFLGIAITFKQSAIFTLPFFWPYLSFPFLIIPSILTITPFLLWNFKDFWYDTVYYLFNMDVIRTDKIIFSQNVLTLILKITGFRLSSIPLYPLLATITIYWVIRKLRPLSLNSLPYNLAVFFLGFHLFATQAYINYFFLIANLLILSQVFRYNETNNNEFKANKQQKNSSLTKT